MCERTYSSLFKDTLSTSPEGGVLGLDYISEEDINDAEDFAKYIPAKKIETKIIKTACPPFREEDELKTARTPSDIALTKQMMAEAAKYTGRHVDSKTSLFLSGNFLDKNAFKLCVANEKKRIFFVNKTIRRVKYRDAVNKLEIVALRSFARDPFKTDDDARGFLLNLLIKEFQDIAEDVSRAASHSFLDYSELNRRFLAKINYMFLTKDGFEKLSNKIKRSAELSSTKEYEEKSIHKVASNLEKTPELLEFLKRSKNALAYNYRKGVDLSREYPDASIENCAIIIVKEYIKHKNGEPSRVMDGVKRYPLNNILEKLYQEEFEKYYYPLKIDALSGTESSRAISEQETKSTFSSYKPQSSKLHSFKR